MAARLRPHSKGRTQTEGVREGGEFLVQKVREDWRKLHNEEFHNFYSSPI